MQMVGALRMAAGEKIKGLEGKIKKRKKGENLIKTLCLD